MKIAICSDKTGLELKDDLKQTLKDNGIQVIDLAENGCEDFIESAKKMAHAIKSGECERGILIDQYGVGSFMAINKIKGMIAALVSDEHSAKMTRDHNSSSVIVLGAGVVGKELAKSCVQAFISSEYSGGRHQIRVDMLNKMC